MELLPDLPFHPGWVALPLLSVAAMYFVRGVRRVRRVRRVGLFGLFGLFGRGTLSEPRAALFYGLVATAFLWPALAIPDGVPSPSATLYQHAPWQALAEEAGGPDPSAGNAALPDVTYQIQPWLLLLRSQLRAGELPFWNPHSFLGQPFWANGQSAPLFPLHLVFAALPAAWGFLLLPWLRIVLGALGTRRLARALGVSPSGALLAGVVFPLSGLFTGYLLFPMANALVLVPWVLWATERLASGRGSWRPLALCVALLALAGHPGTLSHTALLSALYLLVRNLLVRSFAVRGIPWRPLAGWAGSWAVGGALAAVHLLPVAFYLPETARWGDPDGPPPGPGPPWGQVLAMAFRILDPWVYGRAEHGTWHGSFYEPGSRVFVGLLTLLLAGVAVQSILARGVLARGLEGDRPDRDRRWLAVLCLLLFSALVAYRTPVLLQAVESLPVVGRALHHRLLFGVDLTLALLAGLGLDRLAGPSRRIVVAAGLVAAGFAALAVFVLWGRGQELSDLAGRLPWLVWLAVVTMILLWIPRRRWVSRRASWWLALPAVLVAVELTVAHAPSAPGLSAAHLYPPTGATEFLAERPGNFAGVGQTLRPGTAMVYGLHDLRGDDPARPRRYDRMFEALGSTRTPFFHPVEEWDDPWLDAAGVRWVMAPPGRRAPAPGWRLAYDGDDARVFERPTARPEAWLAGVSADPATALEVVRPSNSRVRVAGLGGAAGRLASRLVVSQAWAPGWTVSVVGGGGPAGAETRPTVAHDGFLLALDLEELPRGAEAVEFVYRPPGLRTGALVSLLAGLLLLLPFPGTERRPRAAGRRPPPSGVV